MKTKILLLILTGIVTIHFALAQTTYTFTGNGNWSNATNWSNNSIPPAILTAGNAIVIDPVSYGECLLDVEQTILYGASFTIMAGKRFRMPYSFVINRPPNASDSISILIRMEDNYGTKVNFTYDTIHKRYSNWYSYYRSYNYDSTFVHYNEKGQVWYLERKASTSTQLSVCKYSNTGLLSKIYRKRNLETDTSDAYYISSYDSLVYSNKNQVVAMFTIYVYGLGKSTALTYYPDNDTLLKTMSIHTLSATNSFILYDSLAYDDYDSRPNPFYPQFANQPFYAASINGMYPWPRNAVGGGSIFSMLSAHNCTSAGGTTIKYNYNCDLMPILCYAGAPPPEGDWNAFYYKKVHR